MKKNKVYEVKKERTPVAFVAILGIFIFSFVGIFVEKVYAYLDPGSGSYFFQLLIAIVIGGLFAVKKFWAKIVIFFVNLFSKRKKNG